jgi:lipopolysaccharide biosynthesis regulator YciM
VSGLFIVIIVCVLALIVYRITATVTSRRARGAGRNPYVAGMTALADGEQDKALNYFKQAVREEPQSIDAYLRLGDVLRESGDVPRAIQIHRELTVRTGVPKEAMARIMLSLARDYAKSKRYDRASATYEALLKNASQHATALRELLDVYEEMGEWDKAYLTRREISKITKVDDTHELALYKAYVGKRYLEGGRLKEAESSLKDAIKIDSECVPGYLYLGDLYYQEGKIDDAVSSWRRIVTMFPEVAYVTFRRLEKAFYEKGRFEKIIDLYNDVLERNPSDVRTLMTLAYIQRRKGNLDDAIGLCRTALDFEPESRSVKQALARLFYEKGEIELSLKTMVEAFNGFPTDDETYTCKNCGYKVNEALWRCPGCKHWETFI